MSMCTASVLDAVRRLYGGCEDIEFVGCVAQGYLSQNAILRNGKTAFFLKQYRMADPERVQEIHRAKFIFAERGIPIILPIPAVSNQSFFECEGRLYALFPFVEGRMIRRSDHSQPALASAGEMLARIHLLSCDAVPQIVREQMRAWDPERFFAGVELIRERLRRIQVPSSFDELALKAIGIKMQIVQQSKTRLEDVGLKNDHLIHGDYHGQNIFFDNADQVKWVFDLEKTELAPRSYELVRSMDFLCFANQYEAQNINDAKTYFRAYTNAYPITLDELLRGVRLYFLKKAHSLWVESEHYLHDNQRVDCFLESEVKMLEYYAEHAEGLIRRVFETDESH